MERVGPLSRFSGKYKQSQNSRFTNRTSTNLGRSHLPHVCTKMIKMMCGKFCRWMDSIHDLHQRPQRHNLQVSPETSTLRPAFQVPGWRDPAYGTGPGTINYTIIIPINFTHLMEWSYDGYILYQWWYNIPIHFTILWNCVQRFVALGYSGYIDLTPAASAQMQTGFVAADPDTERALIR